MKTFSVLLVVPLKNVAGAEISTLMLAKGLEANGHRVSVLCSRGPMMDEYRKQGIIVVEGVIDRRGPYGLVSGVQEIRRCLMREEFEIVHLQNGFLVPAAYAAARTLGRRRPAIAWHCRGVKNFSYIVAGRLFNWLTDSVIANCDSERKRLIENGLRPHKIRTIYNCLNIPLPDTVGTKDPEVLKELGVPVDTPLVGMVGQLVASKGHEFFLAAAPLIRRACPNVKFIIVGHGPLEQALRTRALDLGIAEDVVFLGARRDMHRIYSVIDVLAVPSLGREATNNPVAEAMAFAKPVVASDVGGIPELVQHRGNGILVPPRDARKLAEAILLMLEDKQLSGRLGSAGRERIIKDFSVARLVREVEEVYEDMTAGRSKRSAPSALVHNRREED